MKNVDNFIAILFYFIYKMHNALMNNHKMEKKGISRRMYEWIPISFPLCGGLNEKKFVHNKLVSYKWIPVNESFISTKKTNTLDKKRIVFIQMIIAFAALSPPRTPSCMCE